MKLAEFKGRLNEVILQSNSYEGLCDSYLAFVTAYKLGQAGDDIFEVVLHELVKRLEYEKSGYQYVKGATNYEHKIVSV